MADEINADRLAQWRAEVVRQDNLCAFIPVDERCAEGSATPRCGTCDGCRLAAERKAAREQGH